MKQLSTIEDEAKITVKLDKKQDKLIFWYGNVMSLIIRDRFGHLVAPGHDALHRAQGPAMEHLLAKMPKQMLPVIMDGQAVVLTKKECFL